MLSVLLLLVVTAIYDAGESQGGRPTIKALVNWILYSILVLPNQLDQL